MEKDAFELLIEFLKTDDHVKDAVTTTDKFGNGILQTTLDDDTVLHTYVDGYKPLYVAWSLLTLFREIGVIK